MIIPSQLRTYTQGRDQVDASGTTLSEVMADLEVQFPGLRFRVIDEKDRVRPHICLFVGSTRCDDLTVPIPLEARVQIVGALSGG